MVQYSLRPCRLDCQCLSPWLGLFYPRVEHVVYGWSWSVFTSSVCQFLGLCTVAQRVEIIMLGSHPLDYDRLESEMEADPIGHNLCLLEGHRLEEILNGTRKMV